MMGTLAKAWPVLLRLAIVAAFVAMVHGAGQKAGRAEVQGRWDAERVAAALASVKQTQEAAQETTRRHEVQQEISRVSNLAHARNQAAALAGAAAAERLRVAYADRAATASEAPSHPEAARQCQSEQAALAERLALCGRDIARLDAFWRAAHATGEACERSYDSLEPHVAARTGE